MELGEDLISLVCLVLNASSCKVLKSGKLGCLECVVVGVFIAPPTKMVVGEICCRRAHRTVRCAIGHCPVRQPRHPTVRVRPLELLTAGSCSLSGAPSGAYFNSTRAVRTVHCSLLQSTVGALAIAPAGTPDSPVLHRTVR